MNIAHVLFSFNNGGIENLVVDLLNNWPKKDNLLLCIVNDSYNKKLLKKINNNKVKIVCLDRPVGGKNLEYLKQLNLELVNFDAQIVHCHSNNILKFCLPLKIIHKDWKMILHIHDAMIYKEISSFDVCIHKIFVSKIIAISKTVQKSIIDRGMSSKKVVLVYNGIDFSRFNYTRHLSDKKVVLNVARLVPKVKGQDILIKAISIVNNQLQENVYCCLAGGAPKEHMDYIVKLRKEVNEYDLNDTVKFLGNQDNIPYLLSKANLFVLPSRDEGFGISIVEAMAAKVPVIASNLEGPREIIGNNNYGYLFSKNNYQELAHKIEYVLNNDQTALVEKAYNYALSHFSIQIMIKKLSVLYASILSE